MFIAHRKSLVCIWVQKRHSYWSPSGRHGLYTARRSFRWKDRIS